MEHDNEQILNNLYKRLGRNLVLQRAINNLKNTLHKNMGESESADDLNSKSSTNSTLFKLGALNFLLIKNNAKSIDDILNIWESNETQPIFEILTDNGVSDFKSLYVTSDEEYLNDDAITYFTDLINESITKNK